MKRLDFIPKPIPKKIAAKIKKMDHKDCPEQKGSIRFYSYLTTIKGDLFKITVAAKTFYGKWHLKQVAAHGVKSDKCFVKDMEYCGCSWMGFRVGWHAEGLKRNSWYEDGCWWDAPFKSYNPCTLTVNLEHISKFPEFKYSACQYKKKNYGGCVIAYLKTYVRYPQTEYLVKFGFWWLYDKISILKQVAKDKAFCKWLITHKDEIGNCDVGTIIKSYKTGKSIKQIQDITNFKKIMRKDRYYNNDDFAAVKELFKEDMEKLYLYLANQKSDPNSYRDYLTACNFLGLDMTLPKNRLPHDFKRWHDIRIDQYNSAKAKQKAKEKAELQKQLASVAEKYLTLQNCKQGVYAVFIARSQQELEHEGKVLNHCVGRMNYDQRIAREESLIFFVRPIEQLDVPFVTIEYSPKSKKVLQCYGLDSKKPDDNVLSFVNDVWLPYANKTIKRLAA